jgi:hypothetical protein
MKSLSKKPYDKGNSTKLQLQVDLSYHFPKTAAKRKKVVI